jgi:hypothetical protein
MSRAELPTAPDSPEALDAPPATQRKPAPPGFVYLPDPPSVAVALGRRACKAACAAVLKANSELSPGLMAYVSAWQPAQDTTERDGCYVVILQADRKGVGFWRAFPPADLRPTSNWLVERINTISRETTR